MLKFVIGRGFDVNLRYDSNSPTLLEFAISRMRYCIYDFFKTLVENGADINVFHSKEVIENP